MNRTDFCSALVLQSDLFGSAWVVEHNRIQRFLVESQKQCRDVATRTHQLLAKAERDRRNKKLQFWGFEDCA